jgi:hypothetical protein
MEGRQGFFSLKSWYFMSQPDEGVWFWFASHTKGLRGRRSPFQRRDGSKTFSRIIGYYRRYSYSIQSTYFSLLP